MYRKGPLSQIEVKEYWSNHCDMWLRIAAKPGEGKRTVCRKLWPYKNVANACWACEYSVRATGGNRHNGDCKLCLLQWDVFNWQGKKIGVAPNCIHTGTPLKWYLEYWRKLVRLGTPYEETPNIRQEDLEEEVSYWATKMSELPLGPHPLAIMSR